MTRKPSLRAVSVDESPTHRKVPSTVAEAVTSGTRRDELVTMRARIARAIDDPNIRGADLAALTRRLMEVGKELEALDKAAEEDASEASVSPDEDWDASAI